MNEIEYIEDRDYIINPNNYLHAFTFEHDHLITMLDNGIKAPILLKKPFEGSFNGSYYVSLMRYEDCEHDVYKKLIKRPMFIINDNIKTIYAGYFPNYRFHNRLLMESPLPFRCSPYDNEYQKFLRVNPDDIIGLNYNLFNEDTLGTKEKLIRLRVLRDLILELKRNKKELEIVDYSNSKIINKDKVLSLNLKRTF